MKIKGNERIKYIEEVLREVEKRENKEWKEEEQKEFWNKLKGLIVSGVAVKWDEQLHLVVIDLDKL